MNARTVVGSLVVGASLVVGGAGMLSAAASHPAPETIDGPTLATVQAEAGPAWLCWTETNLAMPDGTETLCKERTSR